MLSYSYKMHEETFYMMYLINTHWLTSYMIQHKKTDIEQNRAVLNTWPILVKNLKTNIAQEYHTVGTAT